MSDVFPELFHIFCIFSWGCKFKIKHGFAENDGIIDDIEDYILKSHYSLLNIWFKLFRILLLDLIRFIISTTLQEINKKSNILGITVRSFILEYKNKLSKILVNKNEKKAKIKK